MWLTWWQLFKLAITIIVVIIITIMPLITTLLQSRVRVLPMSTRNQHSHMPEGASLIIVATTGDLEGSVTTVALSTMEVILLQLVIIIFNLICHLIKPSQPILLWVILLVL